MDKETDIVKKRSSWRGGALLDNSCMTWPFALLSVTNEELVLKAGFGGYRFRRPLIVRIEPYKLSPFQGGIRIRHTAPGYPKTMVFLCTSTSPKSLLRELSSWEFLADLIDIG